MEDRDRSRSPSRRTSKVEQVVGRWLRRSRESTSRERVLDDDGRGADASPQDQRSCPLRVTVQIPLDPELKSHGFTVSSHTPALVDEVVPGGPADGKLFPGDQLVKINNVAIDDLSARQASDVIKECQDSITMTVLRVAVGPKSSFITPEKRAKLKSNPVKVRFAEEVVVNGHSQGNSLLFLPNVLKVYLENGQTKAFKFEPKTTVKDIVMTLKQKLSISRIEHFSLVLEQQYSISKLFLLHEDELIQDVAQKRETHDYRCLFRVCFMPKYPQELLEGDPVAFEYLYLQSVSDVLQERFAVEMKCNTALRLAALHIQERLASTGQSNKTPLKTVIKDWGLESFVSSTLLRNMREKDLRKAVNLHLKKIVLQEYKHKPMTVNQARLNYLSEMTELKSFGGRSFSATLMLQDRESTVSLLVGAQYGVSQVINHKLSIMNTLTDFGSITRVELVPESERVSLVKIYMQDIKSLTLLLEVVPAKDLSCLVAGYCKVFIDPQISVFPWTVESKSHRISAEEGYVSRCCSDSEDSEVDALLARATSPTQTDSDIHSVNGQAAGQEEEKANAEEEEDVEDKSEKESVENGVGETKKVRQEEQAESVPADEGDTVTPAEENDTVEINKSEEEAKEEEPPCVIIVEDPPSETSDSVQTDSRFVTSMSSDSMDALEEDDFLTYFTTNSVSQLNGREHYLRVDNLSPCPNQPDLQDGDFDDELCCVDFPGSEEELIIHAALSSIADCLPSPTEASEEEYSEHDEDEQEAPEDVFESIEAPHGECVFTFNQGDPQRYYNICTNVTPDSGHVHARTASLHHTQDKIREETERGIEPVPILLPPPGFGDSSTDDECFDALEGLIPEEPLSAPMIKERSRGLSVTKRTLSLSNSGIGACERKKREGDGKKRERKDKDKLKTETKNEVPRFRKRIRKRRSFMETEYTSLVSFPEKDRTKNNSHWSGPCHPGEGSNQSSCPMVSSLTNAEGEPAQMESKPIASSKPSGSGTLEFLHGNKMNKATQRKQQVILMEPDTMEFKSVTEIMSTSSPGIVAVRTSTEPKVRSYAMSITDALEEAGAVGGLDERLLDGHLFFSTPVKDCVDSDALPVKISDKESLIEQPLEEPLHRKKSCSLPRLDQTSLFSSKVPTTSLNQNPCTDSLDVESLEKNIKKCSIERRRSRSMSATCRSSLKASGLTRHLYPQMEPTVFIKEPRSDDGSGNPFTQELSFTVSPERLTQRCVFPQCSSGPHSASALRGKVQNLPLYLSRSQEVLTSYGSLVGNDKTERRSSENMPPAEGKSKEAMKAVEKFREIVCNNYTERARKAEPEKSSSPKSLVVTTQIVNGPWGVVASQEISRLQAGSSPLLESKPTDTQPQTLSSPDLQAKPDLTCSSVLSSVCETVIESAETPMEVCGCQSAYTNCFSSVLGNGSFDDELTVYEFSCRTQQTMHDRVALMTSSIPPSSLSGSSSSFSPSSPLPAFSRVILPLSSSSELGPLLSPLDTPDCFLSDPHVDAITALLAQHYPLPPTGFLALQRDVDTLLTVLEGAMKDQDCTQRHPRDTCADHFSENKRRLHVESRGFLAGCQRVVKAGQTPAEMLQALADSFHSLVQLTAVCLSFSSCQRCQERHSQTLSGLADVTQTYQEFARAAERLGMATERRTCHELSIKLLARQCTALTTSVFCLTQLFRTLTAL